MWWRAAYRAASREARISRRSTAASRRSSSFSTRCSLLTGLADSPAITFKEAAERHARDDQPLPSGLDVRQPEQFDHQGTPGRPSVLSNAFYSR